MARKVADWCGRTVGLAIGLGCVAAVHADLVAHWPLDEGAGEEFANRVDPAMGGFLADDTVTIEWVAVQPDADGSGPSQASAIEFSGDNSWIQTNFPGIGGNGPRTVTFWMKTSTDTSNNHGIVAWGDSNTNGAKWHVRLNNNEGNGVLGAIRTEPQGGQNVATTPINDGNWHHVASVFPDGATTISQLLHYVDGVLDPRSGGGDREVNTSIGEGADPVMIGARRQGQNVNFFPGVVADVRIYDEALSPEELRALAGTPSEVPALSAFGFIVLTVTLLAGAVWTLRRRLNGEAAA